MKTYLVDRIPNTYITESRDLDAKGLVEVQWPNGVRDLLYRSSVLSPKQLRAYRALEAPAGRPFQA